MGGNFAFMGNQYRINVGGEDFYIDLLLYHRRLISNNWFITRKDEKSITFSRGNREEIKGFIKKLGELRGLII